MNKPLGVAVLGLGWMGAGALPRHASDAIPVPEPLL